MLAALLLDSSTGKVGAFSPQPPSITGTTTTARTSSSSSSSALGCVESTAARHYKEALRIQGPFSFSTGTTRRAHSNLLYTAAVSPAASAVAPKRNNLLTQLEQKWASFVKSLGTSMFRRKQLAVWFLQALVTLFLVWRAVGGTNNSLWLAWDRVQASILWYTALLETNPVVTKSISAGVVGVMGDFLAQRLEANNKEKEEKKNHMKSSLPFSLTMQSSPWQPILNWFTLNGRYNGRRGLSTLADGLFLSGPLMHFGYELFENVLPISGEGSTLAALGHVMADTLLLDSVFVAITFWVTGWFEGYSTREVLRQFRHDYIPALKAGGLTSMLVLPIELACFRFLPLAFRVLAVNFIDILWDAVISHVAHRSRGQENFQQEAVKIASLEANISQ